MNFLRRFKYTVSGLAICLLSLSYFIFFSGYPAIDVILLMSYSFWFALPLIYLVDLFLQFRSVGSKLLFILKATFFSVVASGIATLAIWYLPFVFYDTHPLHGSGNFTLIILPIWGGLISILGMLTISTLVTIFNSAFPSQPTKKRTIYIYVLGVIMGPFIIWISITGPSRFQSIMVGENFKQKDKIVKNLYKSHGRQTMDSLTNLSSETPPNAKDDLTQDYLQTIHTDFLIGNSERLIISDYVIQPDQKRIIIYEIKKNNVYEQKIVRLNHDGSPDQGFYYKADVIKNYFEKREWKVSYALVNDICIDSVGNILLAVDYQLSKIEAGGRISRRVGLLRLFPDGRFDENFESPYDRTRFEKTAFQKSGHLIAVAGATGSIVRLNPDMTVDSVFTKNAGAGFTAHQDYPTQINNIFIQDDDKVVIAGYFLKYNNVLVGGLVRLNADGRMDADYVNNLKGGFFKENQVGEGYTTELSDAIMQSDQKVVLSHSNHLFGGKGLLRINADGTRDTEFMTNTANAGQFGGSICYSLYEQNDGKILAGNIYQPMRFNADGTEDVLFNQNIRLGMKKLNLRSWIVDKFIPLNNNSLFIVTGGIIDINGNVLKPE